VVGQKKMRGRGVDGRRVAGGGGMVGGVQGLGRGLGDRYGGVDPWLHF
jgi:hypothetical protein